MKIEPGPTDYATPFEKIAALGVLIAVAVVVVVAGWVVLTLWLSAMDYVKSAPVLVPR